MKSLLTFGKPWAVALLFGLLCGGPALASGDNSITAASLTAQTTKFLQEFVNKEGKVNYAGIQRDSDALGRLLTNIAEFNVAKAEMADQCAFYLNAYNTSGEAGVLYVNQFRKENRVPTWYSVECYPYSWSLNDQQQPETGIAEVTK
ncbi:hypothetical protein [Hymenobacter terricola]|uniref:hypothetical protein n=1 Tax=Hymenobacter terricola TaxID=2819236 RepID=UPI001B312BDA|nr:hypothetical protein [Hymenobacter terricola]